jgi:hypothetical protein
MGLLALLLIGLAPVGTSTSAEGSEEARVSDLGGPELQLDPSLSLHGWSDKARGDLLYTPRLVFLRDDRGGSQLLHRMRLTLGAPLFETALVTLEERLTRGSSDFSLMELAAEGSPITFDVLPLQKPILYQDASTVLTLTQAWTHRLKTTAEGGYDSGGAVGDVSQLGSAHYQHGVHGSASFFWTGVHNTAGVEVEAAGARYTDGSRISSQRAAASWQFTFLRGFALQASAGAAHTRQNLLDDVLPVASAKLARALPEKGIRVGGSIEFRYAPAFDFLVGKLVPRADTLVTLGAEPVRHVLVTAMGGLSRSPSSSDPLRRTIRIGSLALGWTFHKGMTLAAGVRYVSHPASFTTAFVGCTMGPQQLVQLQ